MCIVGPAKFSEDVFIILLFQIPPVVDLVSRNGSWLVSGAGVVAGDIENKK